MTATLTQAALTKCPRCFCILDANLHMWALAPTSGTPRYFDEIASAFLGAKTDIGAMFGWDRPPGYAGPPPPHAATQALRGPVVEICPVCHFVLPDRWREGQAYCIAMAGARATGKSLYIGVLVKQLQLLCERLGYAMEPVTRSTATAYATNYETPLFVQRGLIPPTPTVMTQTSTQREPLIFSIGNWHGLQRYLVLRNVAGEDMESGDLHSPPFRFFSNAEAVFFMFDPLRVQSIRDQLHDLLPPQNVSGGDPAVCSTTCSGQSVRTTTAGGDPVQVDALRVLRDVEGSEWGMMSNAGAAYLRDTSDAPLYDDKTASCCMKRCAVAHPAQRRLDGRRRRKPVHTDTIEAPLLRGVGARSTTDRTAHTRARHRTVSLRRPGAVDHLELRVLRPTPPPPAKSPRAQSIRWCSVRRRADRATGVHGTARAAATRRAGQHLGDAVFGIRLRVRPGRRDPGTPWPAPDPPHR